jgi:hypothetical protein
MCRDGAEVEASGARPRARSSGPRGKWRTCIRLSSAGRPPADQVEADMPRRHRGGRAPTHARAGASSTAAPPPRPRTARLRLAMLRRHGGSGRAWRSPSAHTRRPGLRAASARRALGLDEVAPVHRTQQAQAADAVADRHLCGGLRLVLSLHQLLDRLPAFGQMLLDPGQRQGQRGAAPCRRRASSATKALVIGGFERAMSATTRIRLLGSCRRPRSCGPPIAARPDCARSQAGGDPCTPRAADSRSAPGAA